MTELEILRTLLDGNKAKLGVHIRKMNSPGSPVYRAAENVVPALAVLIGSFAMTALVHFYLGAAVLAVGCWWWLAKHMPRVRDAVFDRTAALVLADEKAFDLWWASGALSLYARTPDGTGLAAHRRDDWRAGVRGLPPELETLPSGQQDAAAS